MNVENNSNSNPKGTVNKCDAETEFHIAFGWFTALSVSIATAALAVIS